MRKIPGNWFLRWLTTQLSPLWQWFIFLCLALVYLAWRGSSPVQLDLLTIAVGLLWLVAYAFRWFVDRAGTPPFEPRVVPGGTGSTELMSGWPENANPFLEATGVRLSFTGYSGTYWVPIYHWVLDHSRVLRAQCWAAPRNRFAMTGRQFDRARKAAAILTKAPSRLVDLDFPTSLRSMYHESARGRFVMLGWYWCEVLGPERMTGPESADLAKNQEEIISRLAVPSGPGRETRSEFLLENPLITYRPLVPHGESNPALLVRDDGSLDRTPDCVVGTDPGHALGETREARPWRELLVLAQRLISGGLAPLVTGVLLLAPVTGFVPWSALTGKILTAGYAVSLTYLAASEAARKLAGRKSDLGVHGGLSFTVDGTQFHMTVLATAAYDRLAAWAANLSVKAVDVHSISEGPVRDVIRLLRSAAGTSGSARLRVLTAGRDGLHFADSRAAEEVVAQATATFDRRGLAGVEVREMGFPSGLDLILIRGSDIAGRERIAGIVAFRSCHLEPDGQRLAEIADILPADARGLAELLSREGYVVSGRLVTSPLPHLSIAFCGSPDDEYIGGTCGTFGDLWAASVPGPLVQLPATESAKGP